MKRRKKVISKKDAFKKHSSKRMRQRYGLNLTKDVRKEMLRQIQKGSTTYRKSISSTRSIHDVIINKNVIRVIYDKPRKEIVTVLPDKEKEDLWQQIKDLRK